MDSIRKKYVRVIDGTRLLLVFNLSILAGALASALKLPWVLSFGVIIITSLVFGAISHRMIVRKMEEKFLLVNTIGFMIFSVLLDIFLIAFLVVNKEYVMLGILFGIYLTVWITRGIRRRK